MRVTYITMQSAELIDAMRQYVNRHPNSEMQALLQRMQQVDSKLDSQV